MAGSTIITAMRFCPAADMFSAWALSLLKLRLVGDVGQRYEGDVVRSLEGGEPGVEVGVGKLDAVDLRGPRVLQQR